MVSLTVADFDVPVGEEVVLSQPLKEGTSGESGGGGIKEGIRNDPKQVQIIKLVTIPNSGKKGKAVGSKGQKSSLKPIVPNIGKSASPKVLVQSATSLPDIKPQISPTGGLNNQTAATLSSAFIGTNQTGSSVIMVPANFIQNANLQGVINTIPGGKMGNLKVTTGQPLKAVALSNTGNVAIRPNPTSGPVPGQQGNIVQLGSMSPSKNIVGQAIKAAIGSPTTRNAANYVQIAPNPPGGPVTVKFQFNSNSPSTQSNSTNLRTSYVPIAPSPLTTTNSPSASQILAGLSSKSQNGTKTESEMNRPRKACNCTKSQCLKLYCDCFANGEFCNSCNCFNCFNNLEHEEDRQKAIKSCLERNPQAFHPKIGKSRGDITERRHTKGCNCRRSGCLKNYCECYEAKILCSELCKCMACKNYEDSYERKTLMHLADAAEVRSAQQSVTSKAKLWGNDFVPKLPIRLTDKSDRLHCSFITPEVLDATCNCLLATAEDCEKNQLPFQLIEEKIVEEFGNCLKKIIDTADEAKRGYKIGAY